MIFNDCVIFAEINMVSAGIIGLVAIIAIVAAATSAKTWHWVNIVFLILTLFAGVGAITGMTKAFKIRYDAMKDFRTNEKLAEDQEAALQQLRDGNPMSATYEPGSLRYADEKLSLAFEGRGRVWFGGKATPSTPKLVKYTFSTARNPDTKDTLKDAEMFIFAEKKIGDKLIPSKFIASVRVVGESPTDVDLQMVAPADGQQFMNPTTTWTLYEKMPQDRHGIFKDAIVAKTNPDASFTKMAEVIRKYDENDANSKFDLEDISLLRKILRTEYLSPTKLGFDANSKEYEALLDEYTFDGLELGKIQSWIDANPAGRTSTRFEPRPEEVFVEYRFDKDSTNDIPVNANGSLATDGQFNQQGLAVEAGLKADGAIKFRKDDFVWVDQRSADGYQREDARVPAFNKTHPNVTETRRIYRRELTDFPYEFKEMTLRANSLLVEINRIREANEVQLQAFKESEKQIVARQTAITAFSDDQAKLAADKAKIDELAAAKKIEMQSHVETIANLEKRVDIAYTQLRAYILRISRQAFARK